MLFEIFIYPKSFPLRIQRLKSFVDIDQGQEGNILKSLYRLKINKYFFLVEQNHVSTSDSSPSRIKSKVMSAYKSISQVIKEIEYWLRLATILHGPLKQNLLCVLHNKSNNPSYQGLPEHPSELYKELSTTHKSAINKLVKAKVKDQLEILLPKNSDNKTYSEAFDVTLLVVLIINCTTLSPPQDGWYKTPPDSDTGVAANVVRGREWRSEVKYLFTDR